MALNEIFKVGQSISLPVPTGTKSGSTVRVGVLNGVAVVDEGTGGNDPGFASVDLFGGHLYVLASAAVGDAVYITSAGALTKTAAGNKLFGAVTHLHRDGRAVILTSPITV